MAIESIRRIILHTSSPSKSTVRRGNLLLRRCLLSDAQKLATSASALRQRRLHGAGLETLSTHWPEIWHSVLRMGMHYREGRNKREQKDTGCPEGSGLRQRCAGEGEERKPAMARRETPPWRCVVLSRRASRNLAGRPRPSPTRRSGALARASAGERHIENPISWRRGRSPGLRDVVAHRHERRGGELGRRLQVHRHQVLMLHLGPLLLARRPGKDDVVAARLLVEVANPALAAIEGWALRETDNLDRRAWGELLPDHADLRADRRRLRGRRRA
mmetsp:Transcript_49635/g.113524  ORF Transcript_49635/g.113524 Transcript_49635/m.113524 type:complete len:274 (+) Transcript_49635:175-996(+)